MPIQQGLNVVVYTGNPDPEQMNTPTLYAPGDLGREFEVDTPIAQAPGVGPVPEAGAAKKYRVVRSDSGMLIPPTRGAVAWWKNQAKQVVTTDPNAIGRNYVAGIFKASITPGNYCVVQRGGPSYVQVTAADAAAVVVNDSLIPSAADHGRASRVAAGTAPTYTLIGTAAGPVVGGNLILARLALVDLP